MLVPIEPGWLSLLPPLAAIALALIFREVVISLFAGVWLGALFIAEYDPLAATLTTIDRFVVDAIAADPGHVAIIIFSLLLGGMVGVIGKSGGTRGIVEALRPHATSPRRGQFFTWLSGLAIFFDDYANTLIVGNSMRPVTDGLRISREKLAYIVDSTAAPVAAIALVSTWIGFEISLIADSLETAAANAPTAAIEANLLAASDQAFTLFVQSIPYRFYPILAIVFVFLIVLTRRDFGPMREAEHRAATGGGVYRPGATLAANPEGGPLEPSAEIPHRWYNAAAPVLTVVAVALLGIYYSGLTALEAGEYSIFDIVGASDPFDALLWASLAGCIVAIALAVGQRLLTITESIDAWLNGMKAMMLAIIILVLAWSLGDVTQALGTGPYLASVLQDALPLALLPALTFLVAAAISFATGTSWGTMAILFPVVIPLAVSMGAAVGFGAGADYTILLGVISSILAGAIFGDHCSPISDTTVMSSMASACDHIDHVRTQLPYALLVGAVGIAVGDIPTAFGLSPWISIVVGTVILYAVLRFFGEEVGEEREGIHISAEAVAQDDEDRPARVGAPADPVR